MPKYNVGRIQHFKEYIIVEASSKDEAFDKLRDEMDGGSFFDSDRLNYVYFEGDGELVCAEVKEETEDWFLAEKSYEEYFND